MYGMSTQCERVRCHALLALAVTYTEYCRERICTIAHTHHFTVAGIEYVSTLDIPHVP